MIPFNWIGNTDKRALYKTVLLSFDMTFSVEFFQFFIGRSADIDDVITNLLGAMIGYTILKFLMVH